MPQELLVGGKTLKRKALYNVIELRNSKSWKKVAVNGLKVYYSPGGAQNNRTCQRILST